jgi:hypothetical protein
MEDVRNDGDDFEVEVETVIEMPGLISGLRGPMDSDPPPDGGRTAWMAGECCMLPTLTLLKCINNV